MRDLEAPGGQSPSLTTQCDRESASASDIEMVSLVSAHEYSDQVYDPHEIHFSTAAGASDLAATLGASEHRPRDPSIESTLDASEHRLRDPHIEPRFNAITAAPDKRPSAYNRLIMDTWVCEAAAMVFSIGCIVAIAFTVGNYDGEPIPSLSLDVTLNTVISVLSTAARAALIFVVSSSIGQLK